MKSLLLLLLVALAIGQAQDWELVSSEFENLSLQPADLADWTFHGQSTGNEISYCGEVGMIGGYRVAAKDAILSKTFSDLPEHYKLKVKITVFFIDSWDNEKFQILVNGNQAFSEISHQSWHSEQLCGGGQKERVTTLEAEVAHFGQEVTIAFTSNLNENSDNESWGVRDFQLSLAKCKGNCHQITEEFVGEIVDDDFYTNGWQVGTPVQNGLVTDCNGDKILGGYQKFGQGQNIRKTFTDLPPHYKAVVAFKLWQIDSWDTNEALRLVIDGRSAHTQMKNTGTAQTFQCDNSNHAFEDTAIDVTVEVPHFHDSLTIRLEDSLNQATTDESWGISNFRIYLIACEDDCEIVSEELGDDSFNADDLQGWSVDGRAYQKVGACGRTSIVGGYNELAGGILSKTYRDLPPHTHIVFAVQLWLIDTWDNEDFTIAVDQVAGLTTTKYNAQWAVDLGNACGGGHGDEVQELYLEMPHFKDTAKIQLISGLNQAASDESWGFREIKVYVLNKHDGDDDTQIASEFTETVVSNTLPDNWSVENPVAANQATSNCGDFGIVGGYNTFSGQSKLSATFTELPAHDFVTFYFKIYFLDTWDNEAFIAKIDGLKQKSLTQVDRQFVASQQVCGHGDVDEIKFTQITFSHDQPELTLELYTMLNEGADNESWGIRDFHMFVGTHQRALPDCPTIYSECDFQGESFNLCENINDFSSHEFRHQVKSVWVPEGWSVTLYEDAEFEGRSHAMTEPQVCLEEGPVYQFIKIQKHQLKVKNNMKNQGKLKKSNHLNVQRKSHLRRQQ